MSVKLQQGAEQAIAEEFAKGVQTFNGALIERLNKIGTDAVTRARRTVTENGIPAAVFGQNSSYVFLNYANPLEVKVAAEDYEDALSLLAAADKAE